MFDKFEIAGVEKGSDNLEKELEDGSMEIDESKIKDSMDYWENMELPDLPEYLSGPDGTEIIKEADPNRNNTIELDNETERVSLNETDNPGKKGGRYLDVKQEGEGDKYEVHHIPADAASNLERGDGPAIKMEKEDHRRTASCGNSREAREYRARQAELIRQGKFREAVQMDIDDIRDKFGDKYDDAISEMMEYVDQLERKGEI